MWGYLIEVSVGTARLWCWDAQRVPNLDAGARCWWRAVDDRKRRRTWMGALRAISRSWSSMVVGAITSASGGGVIPRGRSSVLEGVVIGTGGAGLGGAVERTGPSDRGSGESMEDTGFWVGLGSHDGLSTSRESTPWAVGEPGSSGSSPRSRTGAVGDAPEPGVALVGGV